MDDTEQEQFHDDIEITDLPEDSDTRRKPDHGRERAGLVPPLLGWLFRQHLSPRQRFLQRAVISGSVALIVLIVLASSATTRNALLTGIVGRQPTPIPTLVPGTDLFYIQGAPSWGYASLDGRTLSHLPIIGKESPLRLSRGNHIVKWYAAPFQPQICLIAIPALVGTDSCVSHNVAQLKPDLFASIITFSESLDSLSNAQGDALARAAQTAVNALHTTEMVRPGEQYLDRQSNLLFATARQPMHATLNLQLDSASASDAPCATSLGRSVISSCQDCRRFCTAPDEVFPASPTNQPWNVLALVSVTWKFTALDGHVVAQNQSDPYNEDEQLIEFSIQWDGENWHVKVSADALDTSGISNPVCEVVQEEITTDGYYLVTGGDVQEIVVWKYFVSGTNLAAGCLAVGMPQQSTADQPRLPVAYLLYRFGVVVTGNVAAHRYWGFEQIADSYEQHIVQQMAAKIPSAVDSAGA